MSKKENFMYGREEHYAKLHKLRHESFKENHRLVGLDFYRNLPINVIRTGDTVYAKERIAEGPNEYSPGGIFAFRGDALLVTKIMVTAEYDRFAAQQNDVCLLCWKYAVRHFDAKPDTAFWVYRNEIMPTDPLITHHDKDVYIRTRGRYKTLESRFDEYKPFEGYECKHPKK